MSSLDVSASQYPYAGWVPTVAGRLSFRHIGESRHPTESRYANAVISDSRVVLAYQRRPLSDLLFEPITSIIYSLDGDFWFSLCAKSSEAPEHAEQIAGTVYIFKSKIDWRRGPEPCFRDSIKALNSLAISVDVQREKNILGAFQRAKESVSQSSDIAVEFVLNRTGTVFFSKPVFTDEALRVASEEYASKFGHDFDRWIADQAYFFVRDLAHTHQHHTPTSDTVLILQKRDGEDEISWRRRIIYALYFYIIGAKRHTKAGSLFQSAGVLAYCTSFKRICELELVDSDLGLPYFNDEALRSSLEAKANEERIKSDEFFAGEMIRRSRSSTTRISVIAAAALIFALFAMFVQPNVETDPWLSGISEALTTHASPILYSLIIIVVVTWILTHTAWHRATSWGRAMLEAANVKRKRSVVWLSLLTLVIVAGTLILGWDGIVATGEAIWDLMMALMGRGASD